MSKKFENVQGAKSGPTEQRTTAPPRREFLKELAMGAGITAVAGLGAQQALAQSEAVRLELPVAPPKVLRSESRVVGNVKETQATIEVTGSNGARMLNESLARETETAATIQRTVTVRRSLFPPNSQVAEKTTVQTVIGDVTKGPVVGDQRHDQVSLTIVDETGVRTLPPMTVKRTLQDPLAGLSPEEQARRIFAEKGLL
jgi:hypothetical protein